MNKYPLIALLILMCASCAHLISPENREGAVSDLPFTVIREDTERYINRLFIFGGIIAQTTRTKDGSEIEVVQSPVDRWGKVISRDRSEGRFIVTAAKHLDPLIFRQGRELVMSGVLTGSTTKALAGSDYVYPVFEAKEIQLRPEEIYPYSDPYYPYDHYWYDPFWFWFRPHLYFHFGG